MPSEDKYQFSSQKYQAGDLLFRQGDSGDTAYIIKSGKIEVYLENADRIISLSTFGKGEIFGEMFLFGGKEQKRTASCRALESTEVINLSRKQLLSMLKEIDPILKHLMLTLVNRLKAMNDKVAQEASRQPDESYFDMIRDRAPEEIEL